MCQILKTAVSAGPLFTLNTALVSLNGYFFVYLFTKPVLMPYI